MRSSRRNGNVVEREVTVGFIGRTSTQTIELRPTESVGLKMTSGPLKGSREIRLVPLEEGARTRLEVSWDFRFSGVPLFAHGFVRRQLERVTEEALSRIAAAVGTVGRPARPGPPAGRGATKT